MEYDIKAKIKNCKQSKKSIYTGYRPSFDIHKQYSTTGVINFLNTERELKVEEECECAISFLTPEAYPKSIWIGKKIIFKEGSIETGYAVVTNIFNKVLESDVEGIEGNLNRDFKIK